MAPGLCQGDQRKRGHFWIEFLNLFSSKNGNVHLKAKTKAILRQHNFFYCSFGSKNCGVEPAELSTWQPWQCQPWRNRSTGSIWNLASHFQQGLLVASCSLALALEVVFPRSVPLPHPQSQIIPSSDLSFLLWVRPPGFLRKRVQVPVSGPRREGVERGFVICVTRPRLRPAMGLEAFVFPVCRRRDDFIFHSVSSKCLWWWLCLQSNSGTEPWMKAHCLNVLFLQQ